MFARFQYAMSTILYKNRLNPPKISPHKTENVMKTMAFDYYFTYYLFLLVVRLIGQVATKIVEDLRYLNSCYTATAKKADPSWGNI
jgi:hypothetical protein